MPATTRLGIFSDPHVPLDSAPRSPPPTGWDFDGTLARLEGVAEHFKRAQVDAIVALGDLAHNGDDATLDMVLSKLATVPAYLWVAPGNHDIMVNPNAVPNALTRAGRNERTHGKDMSSNRTHVCVLGLETPDQGASFRSRSPLPIASWPDELMLVASHFPLIPQPRELAAHGIIYPDDITDRAAILDELLARPAPTLVLHGHLHVRNTCHIGPVLQFSFAALIEHPFECSILDVSVDNGTYRLTRVATPLHAAVAKRDAIFVPESEIWTFDATNWITPG
jgi:Calcineurin-like phosphoesterase